MKKNSAKPVRWRSRAAPSLPATIPELTLPVPQILNFGPPEVITALYRYLAELRWRVIGLGQRIIVDLRSCTSIGPVGVLLLAAEVDRCNYVRPGFVTGYRADHPTVEAHLAMFGFQKAVGIEPDLNLEHPSIVQIESGVGRTPKLSEKLGQVARLTFDLWGDQAFTDRIHGALNEAMTNVLMHAYDPVLMKETDQCEPGRWWVAGFSNPKEDHAWFMALDLGVGMPRSATAKNIELHAFLSRPTRVNDAAVIKNLVVNDERSRTGLPQHGLGVPTMVSLIADRASKGTIWIVSGRGCFLMDKDPSRPRERHEGTFTIGAQACGTLILWKVGRTIMTGDGAGE